VKLNNLLLNYIHVLVVIVDVHVYVGYSHGRF